jgi:hypothetical protein
MKHLVVVMTAFLSVPLTAHAGWFDDPFGLNKAATNAGAVAGKEAAEGLVKASRNITMMTNQFGQILSDYYGDDPTKKESARRLIEGAFGVELKTTGKFDVDVTAVFDKVELGKPIRSDILFVNEENDSQIQAILETSTIFKGEEINAPTLTPATIDEARTQIYTLVDNRLNKADCPKPKDYTSIDDTGLQTKVIKNQAEIDKCLKNNETNALVNAILTTLNFTKTIPSKNSFSRQYTGGKYAVLVVPASDLKSAPNNLTIDITMHQQGDIRKALTVFKNTPKRVDLTHMKKNIAKTRNESYGEFNYFFVDLRIEGLAAAPIPTK